MRSKTDAEIRVAQKAAELAERAVRGAPPFDRFSNHLPLIRDKEYAGKYSEEAKHELLEAYIASAKFSVGGDAYRNDEAYRRIMQFEKPIAEDLRRSGAAGPSSARFKLCPRPPTRMTIGRRPMRRQSHHIPILGRRSHCRLSFNNGLKPNIVPPRFRATFARGKCEQPHRFSGTSIDLDREPLCEKRR
jgi:hypothetical protein